MIIGQRMYGITGWSFENGRTVQFGVVSANDKKEAETKARLKVGRQLGMVIEVNELNPWKDDQWLASR